MPNRPTEQTETDLRDGDLAQAFADLAEAGVTPDPGVAVALVQARAVRALAESIGAIAEALQAWDR